MDSFALKDLHHFLAFEIDGFSDALEETYGDELAADVVAGVREIVSARAEGRAEDDEKGRFGRRALDVDAVLDALHEELDAWVRAHDDGWRERHTSSTDMLAALIDIL